MNIALFVHSGIFRSLQTLIQWWTRSDSPTGQGVIPTAHRGHSSAPNSIANSLVITGTAPPPQATIKPLRVVRVVEAGQSRSCVGRIVISGRMADVCAELDRLAAGEVALS